MTLSLWLDSLSKTVSIRSVCWTFTITSIAACGYAIWKFCTRIKVSRNYSLGERGERIVDDALDDLRFKGYYVINDLQCPKVGNFDHVAIGHNGVFCLETKTASWITGSGEKRITVRGGVVYAAGVPLRDRNPLEQVSRNARKLYQELAPLFTGKKGFFVKQVVVFPGWFVEDKRAGQAMILCEKLLATFIPNESLGYSLSDADIAAIRKTLRSQ